MRSTYNLIYRSHADSGIFNYIAVILCITQRFEKLCRAILASMEVENEPKVSL